MSARRARIKAVVTSFPVRRNMNDVADNRKEKIPEKKTRSAKPESSLKSPSPVNDVIKNHAETVPSPLAQTEVMQEVAVAPQRSEEVSPRNVGSPLGSNFVSPLVHSSETEVNIQKLTPITPEEIPEEPKQESVQSRPVEVEVTDDDFIASLFTFPDCTTEDNIMDGIVPLQAVSSAPNPGDLLNAILADNAEVSFDPILPLPAPIKVRPKLRPVPRLAALRKSSVQTSVSEPEDDSRRALLSGGRPGASAALRQGHDVDHSPHSAMHSLRTSKTVSSNAGQVTPQPGPSASSPVQGKHIYKGVKCTRNESVSSNAGQVTPQPGPSASSPVQGKHIYKGVKCTRNESVSSNAGQVTPQPGPSASSPVQGKHIIYKTRRDMPRRKAAMRRLRETDNKAPLMVYDLIYNNPKSNPIVPDDAQLANAKEEAARKAAIAQGKNKEHQTQMEVEVAPVPQIKLGPGGEIMLDEQSLKRKVSSTVMNEDPSTAGTSSGYRRTKRTALWTDKETARFYRALASVGTDFMLMEGLFPGRTRRDLKLKFKNEERVNAARVEKVFRSTTTWDCSRLQSEFQTEREVEKITEQELTDLKRTKKLLKVREYVPLSISARSLGKSNFREPDDYTPMLRRPKAKTQKTTASSQSATTRRVMPKPKNTLEMYSGYKGKAPVKRSTTTPGRPTNLKEGVIVVNRIENPDSPRNKRVQAYLGMAGGRVAPVTLEPEALKTIVTFMKTGVVPNNVAAGSAESAASSSNSVSQDSRPCPTDPTPAVI